MANYFACTCLIRVVLPLGLSLSVLFRQTGLSFIYLLLLLLLPMVRIPTHKTMAGATGQYLRAVMVLSSLNTIAQVIFQIVLLSMPPYGNFLNENKGTETILQHVGLIRLDGVRVEDGFRYLAPEVLMLIMSVGVYVGCKKLSAEPTHSRGSSASAPSTAAILPPVSSSMAHSKRRKAFFITIGKCVALASLCLAGILRPSVLNGVYFLVFLGGMTWWSCYKKLLHPFGKVLQCVQVFAALHVIVLFVIQLHSVQEFLTSDCNYCRYLGLTFVMKTNGVDPRMQEFVSAEWALFLNPVALLWLYYILGIESYFCLWPRMVRNESPTRENSNGQQQSPTSQDAHENVIQLDSQGAACEDPINQQKSTESQDNLVSVDYLGDLGAVNDDSAVQQQRTVSQSASGSVIQFDDQGTAHGDLTGQRWSTVSQDAHGGVIKFGDQETACQASTDKEGSTTSQVTHETVIQLDAQGAAREEELQPGLWEQIMDFFTSLFLIINRSSYIGANIIMMAWSITYYSWLTFVFLLLAILMWILPNQRHYMMRCSPFLVVYAIFLLLAQYILGMDFTNDEIPDKVNGVNLRQIGFARTMELSCEPLFFKSLYTLFFWLTLRKFLQERFRTHNVSSREDMVAMQISDSLETRDVSETHENKQRSQAMNWLGGFVKSLMIKYWIWVVAIMLFVIGISGTTMTMFRIIYILLFLIFVLAFQLSYEAWRKYMYGFLLTVMVYSMFVLVLIYTYQLDEFPDYWTHYLGISQELQKDIGMEVFQTSELFAELLIPTCFVVITVIQVRYFHKDFLTHTDIKCRSESLKQEASIYGNSVNEDQGPVSENSGVAGDQQQEKNFPMPSLRTQKQLSMKELRHLAHQFKIQVRKVIDFLWLLMELHMLKLMMLSIMLLCVFNVCAVHFFILLLVVVAQSSSGKRRMFICHAVSVLVSVFLLMRMIYQITYFDHSRFAVNCSGNATVGNNADWLGLYKSHSNHTLTEMLMGYIGLIFLATFMKVVTVRQLCKRHLSGEPISSPRLMFPNIQRCHADQDLPTCLKYLLNYGFYKFGIEICLMATVALIGTHMDLYAVLYGIWLCVLVTVKRDKLAKIWGVYQWFITTLIPIQYAMAVGLPSALCIEYPWNQSQIMRNLQEWLFLPNPVYPLPAYKLICDCILLLLVCRQNLVFRVERYYEKEIYAGGNNEMVEGAEQPGFINLVPDHISYTRSWLDIAKRCFLSSFLWVTLAIVFLAGANRVNIFSLGYLLGAFVFLWHGEEIYLWDVPSILKRWNMLLWYNVAVIMVKALLQIIGCMFLLEVKNDACWAVQLFEITCFGNFPAAVGSLPMDNDPTQCNMPTESSSLLWDGVCFGCLIMMRRLFISYYFIHQVNESKAMTLLGSRGAELLEELEVKRLHEHQNEEYGILENVREKIERIKATQQKNKERVLREPESHHAAIRSGDYYMFDELDDDMLEEKVEISSDEEGGKQDGERQVTLSEFLDTAFKFGMGRAADLVLTKGKIVDDPEGGECSSVKSARNTSAFCTDKTDRMPQAQESSPSLHHDHVVPTSPEKSKGSYPSENYPQDEADGDSTAEYASSDTEAIMNVGQRIWLMVRFAWAFVECTMVTLTKHLYHISRDYRYILEVLTMEKKMLKKKPDFGVGVREGSAMIWRPKPPVVENSELSHQPLVSLEQTDETQELRAKDQALIVQLILALWFAILSHSDIVCYFMVFLYQIKSASILSLPVPFMVFLWGTLSIPRPSKTFWVVMITYTEVVVIVKWIFQFEFLPWNGTEVIEKNPFFPPRIIGIESKSDYATYDLFVLLSLFFHRYMLKYLGLWKTAYEEEQKVCLDTEGESGGAQPVTEEDKLTAVAAATAGKDMAVMEHEESRQSFSASVTDNSGMSLPVEEGYLHRRSPASSVSDQVVTQGGNCLSAYKMTGDMPEPGHVRFTDEEPSASNLTEVHTDEKKSGDRIRAFLIFSKRFLDSVKGFFTHLLSRAKHVPVDVYALMFLCDFFNFLVIVFGFESFGSDVAEGVFTYLEENRVPMLFLIMLILQFAFIVVDRALYLRKYILGKTVFQLFLVFGVHVWMFFILPLVTGKQFNAELPPQIWYMVKCFYLVLSAYQIRRGYPARVLGNVMCKQYYVTNMILFKGFMSVPFLFELRALMDWTWTDTSMTLSDWLKMEEIFSSVFQLKCERRKEMEYPQPQGRKKRPLVKYLMGGVALLIFIVVTWFPWVIFALGDTVSQADLDLPYDVPSMDLSEESSSNGKIIGLFVSASLLFCVAIRDYMSGFLEENMFTDLPNVDRILQLCLDIYLVRESGELDLEEDLFAKLIFLYRSPETLIKWTRPRKEDEGEMGNAQPMIAQ